MAKDQLHGEHVRLRAFEPDDWPLLAERHRSGADRLDEPTRLPMSQQEARVRAEDSSRASVDDIVELVVETTNGVGVGTATVVRADRRNGVFTMACWLKAEYEKYSYREHAARQLVRFYFDELGYQKVEVEVGEYDDASVEWVNSLGLVLEGRRRNAVLVGGDHRDVLLFGALPGEIEDPE